MWGAAHAAEEAEIDEGAGSLFVEASVEMLCPGVETPGMATPGVEAPARGFRAELASVSLFATPGRREATSPPVAPYSEPGLASP